MLERPGDWCEFSWLLSPDSIILIVNTVFEQFVWRLKTAEFIAQNKKQGGWTIEKLSSDS